MDEVLRALEHKGLLSAQEVHDIKLRARSQARSAKSAPPEAEPPAAPADTAGTRPTLSFWGRLQPRYTHIGTQGGREGTQAFTFRRARIGVRGALGEDVAFYTQYEASNEVPGLSNAQNLLDAWIRFETFGETFGDLIVGQQFIPGYGRAPHMSASVERKFPEFLSPGTAGRARGLTLRRGQAGAPETLTPGLFGDRLQYGIGVFNAPDLSLNNDNNDLLRAAAVMFSPRGNVRNDEYAAGDLPLRYLLGLTYATSRDRGGLDAGVQQRLTGRRVTLEDEWYGAFAEAHVGAWYGWTSWSTFASEPDDGYLVDVDEQAVDRLRSRAWAAGISRTFALRRAGHRLGLAFQFQQVDNEHPSRTRFFRVLTGNSTDELARGMDQGESYQFIATWLIGPSMRWINEYAWFTPDHDAGYGAWVSQFQLNF